MISNPLWQLLLGILPDTEIAERFGVHCNTVLRRRKKLGIPKCPRKQTAPYLTWIGLVPDDVIATQFGVSPKAVADTRRRKLKKQAEIVSQGGNNE